MSPYQLQDKISKYITFARTSQDIPILNMDCLSLQKLPVNDNAFLMQLKAFELLQVHAFQYVTLPQYDDVTMTRKQYDYLVVMINEIGLVLMP